MESGMNVMMNEDPVDPRLHKPRVADAPKVLWLNYGDIDRDCTHQELALSGEVTWCEEEQFDSDVQYVRKDALLPGWQFTRDNMTRIVVTMPDGGGCVVDNLANDARMIPEEVLFALAKALGV
jgi:hypothetical protein